jgi:outer membrane protein
VVITVTKIISRTLLVLALTALPAAGANVKRLTISDVLAEAHLKNPVMREAEARIQAANAGKKSVRADFYPTASFQYGYAGVTETPVMKTGNGSFQAAHRHLYNWDITVIQPLFTGFALSSRFKIANLDITVRRFEKEQTALDLTRNVKKAYYDLLLSQKLFVVAKDEVEALTAHKKDATLYYDQELIPYNDLLKSEVGLANALQQSEKAQANEQKALAQLNRLLNRPVTDPIEIEDITGVKDIQKRVLNWEVLSRQAIRNRPIMETVRAGLEKLGLAQRVAKSTWYPEITMVGRHGREGDNPATMDNDFSNAHNTSVSVQASWRFWDWGKTRAEVNRTRHHIAALTAQIESIENQIRQEVKNALLDCGVALKNIDTALRSQDQAKENWRITNLQYNQQVATSTDVLDARTFLTQTDTNYYQALYGYLTALAALDRATGKRH